MGCEGLSAESLEIRMARLEGAFYWVVGLIIATILIPVALRFLPS